MPSVSRAVSAWASRWFTAIRGLRVTSAMALAVVSPTSTPPIRPGPAATAMPSMSFTEQFAFFSARATRRSITSTWARAAISGTTPP